MTSRGCKIWNESRWMPGAAFNKLGLISWLALASVWRWAYFLLKLDQPYKYCGSCYIPQPTPKVSPVRLPWLSNSVFYIVDYKAHCANGPGLPLWQINIYWQLVNLKTWVPICSSLYHYKHCIYWNYSIWRSL